MKLILFLLAAIAIVPPVAINATAQPSDPEVQAGIDAYRKADYREALRHFQAAKTESKNAEVAPYLAATVALEFIPASDAAVGDVDPEEEIARHKRLLESQSAEKEKLKITRRMGICICS